MRSAPTLKIWMTPLASVAMLEKFALLKIARCRAPALSSVSSACILEVASAPSTGAFRVLAVPFAVVMDSPHPKDCITAWRSLFAGAPVGGRAAGSGRAEHGARRGSTGQVRQGGGGRRDHRDQGDHFGSPDPRGSGPLRPYRRKRRATLHLFLRHAPA